MASTVTAAGKREIADNGFGTNNWYGHLHSHASNVPAAGNALDAPSVRVASWTRKTSGGNAQAEPSADLSFTAAAGDVGDRPQKLAFWTGSGASGTLLAYGDIYEAGSTTTRLSAIAQNGQGIVIPKDQIEFEIE